MARLLAPRGLAGDAVRAEHAIRIQRNIEADIAGGRPPDPDWNAYAPWLRALWRAAQDDRFWGIQARHPTAAWVARGGRGLLRAPDEDIVATVAPGGIAAIQP